MKDVNFETIIDMQSWCKTWLPNGSSRVRAKQKLLRRPCKDNTVSQCESPQGIRVQVRNCHGGQNDYRPAFFISSRTGSPKSFTPTIPWNLARLVKIFPGIIARQHHTNQKQMGLLREQYAE